MTVRLLLLGALLLAAGPLGAGERLSMRVSPSVAFAPANLMVRAHVEAHDENRSVEIVAESANFYRASEIQLDGGRAPRTSVFVFRGLPGGAYSVRAVLRGAGRRELAVTQVGIHIVDTAGAAR